MAQPFVPFRWICLGVGRAVVLAPVKERPGSVVVSRAASATAVLDRRSTRQPRERAGRDEKMLATEPKDGFKKEDTMPSTQIP
jgi:hypothetical protein